MSIEILITKNNFDHSKEIEKLKSKGTGAIVTFTGIVRDNFHKDELLDMTLEHYPGMTEKQIKKILIKAKTKWNLNFAKVIHRIGKLTPEENIVFVGVSSEHRNEAFKGASYIMDYLKTNATFWKKEKTKKGTRWVDERKEDIEILKKW